MDYYILFIIVFIFAAEINYFKKPSQVQKLILGWNKHCYHIHHWITFSILLLTFITGRYCDDIVFNFILVVFIAIISQGFMYKDAFHIVKACKNVFN